jgi:hypothetical protein
MPRWRLRPRVQMTLATASRAGVIIDGLSGFADPLFFRAGPRSPEAVVLHSPVEKSLLAKVEPEIEATRFRGVELAWWPKPVVASCGSP